LRFWPDSAAVAVSGTTSSRSSCFVVLKAFGFESDVGIVIDPPGAMSVWPRPGWSLNWPLFGVSCVPPVQV
jgi:hypothetical protein